MRKQIQRWMTLLVGLAVVVSLVKGQGTAQSPNAGQARAKKIREIAMERDVEWEGSSGCHIADINLAELRASSSAIVYGRITDTKSFFDESGAPIEQGEIITTEYTVDVLRVLKDTTLETMPPPDKPAPAPLYTPLKIARNGGVVYVNGHRASVKIKGYDALTPGKKYVFFLNWSPDYKAYYLTHCIFGVVMVNDDLSLKSLGSSKELEDELRDMNLETLVNQIKTSDDE